MHITPLIFVAMLAPLPAVAFGDLDCIAFESCADGACAPLSDPFFVTFNWTEETVTVTVQDADTVLDWANSGETLDGLSSVLEYGSSSAPALRIEASGLDITAYYTFSDPAEATWIGACDVRRAA